MYRLNDQVRDLALGYADIHVLHKSRPRALCEFDGERWMPVEDLEDARLGQETPRLRQLSMYTPTDSAYTSTANSSAGRLSPREQSPTSERSPSLEGKHSERHMAGTFRRSSSFRLPGFDYEQHNKSTAPSLSDAESEDVLRDMIVQEHAASAEETTRRPSILASPAYQRNLIQFNDLAVSEVDLSEEEDECNLAIARRHILSAFPKQFEAEALSPHPLTSFTAYSRSENTVEMLHVVLVLESRKVFWKLMGPSKKAIDRVTSLPYCWEADLDLPPLTLDEPRVTDEVECIIMGRPITSTIMCDNHSDDCRGCKGLASEDECFACDGTGIFKKKTCVMCSGNGKYYCKLCKNSCHTPCETCGSSEGPRPILRKAYVTCTRETVISPTMEVEDDNKASLITTAKMLARQTIEAEQFAEGTLPVAACGVLIRQRGHIVCATDLRSGARGLFEVIAELDRVEFKGQLTALNQQQSSRPSSVHSTKSQSSSVGSSWGMKKKKKEEETDVDDNASIKSTASSRLKNLFSRKR